MFFYPFSIYFKEIITTLIVEVGLFAVFISRQPTRVLFAASVNVSTHILLHVFFTAVVIFGYNYNYIVWVIGEILVFIIESVMYYISKSIAKYSKSLLWALVLNISSILVGFVLNIILF